MARVLILLVSGVFLLAHPIFAQDMTFRERLVATDHLSTVIPSGNQYTYIANNSAIWNVYPDLARIGLDLGGTPEVLVELYDPFTRKTNKSWVGVELYEKGDDFFYHHPKTGREYEFGYGRMFTWEDPLDDSRFPPLVRMKGVFELYHRSTADPVRASTSTTVNNVVATLILKHQADQPFVYKTDFEMPASNQLLAPPDGLDDVTNWRFAHVDPGSEKMAKVGKTLMAVFGLSIILNRNENMGAKPASRYQPNYQTDNTIMYYLGYSGLCAQQGATASYLIRSENDFVVPSPYMALEYFISKAGSWNSDFLISCDGPQPFAAMVQTERGGAYKAYRKAGVTVDELYGFNQKTQEEIEKEQKTKPWVQHGTPAEIMKKYGKNDARDRNIYMGQNTAKSSQREIALQTAVIRAPITEDRGGLYRGLYNGMMNGCDFVSVVNAWRDDNPIGKRQTPDSEMKIWNYLVCNGAITQETRTVFPGKSGVPDELDNYVKRVAQDAQVYGSSEATTRGYNIRGFALRGETQCAVEIRVFKGMQLIYTEIANACI